MENLRLKPLPSREEIKQKHRKICEEYSALKEANPNAAPYRIFDTLADRYGMTVPGIRRVIIAGGLYPTPQD